MLRGRGRRTARSRTGSARSGRKPAHDLPGIPEDAIRIEVKDDVLTVSAEEAKPRAISLAKTIESGSKSS